jgi:hypothetical protein
MEIFLQTKVKQGETLVQAANASWNFKVIRLFKEEEEENGDG